MNSFQGWTFDARTVAPQMALEPVPEGWYKVIVKASNIKPTRDPANNMLELQCQVIEGQYQGRILYWNFNLFHSTSQAAVEMAYKALSSLSHVTGQFQLAAQGAQDHVLPMLHNIPFYVHVVVAKGDQGPINNIKNVRDVNGNEPGKQGGAPITQQPAPAMQSSFGAPAGYQPQPAPVQQPQAAPGGWQSGPAPQQAQQPAPGPAPQQQPQQPPQQAWQPPQGAPQQPAVPQQPGQPFGAPQAAPAPGPAPQQAWQPGQSQPVPGMPPAGAAPWGR